MPAVSSFSSLQKTTLVQSIPFLARRPLGYGFLLKCGTILEHAVPVFFWA